MSATAIILEVIGMAVLTVLLMIVLGAFARRFLGVRIGITRILIAGVVGLGAEVGFESQFLWGAEYSPAMIPIQVGIIVFVAVAFLVVAELLVPQGTVPRPDQWMPAVRSTIDRSRRYTDLVRIAAKHKLVPFSIDSSETSAGSAERTRQAVALKAALQDAGGAFVKLGQLLSTRPDVLPVEFTTVLATLQQRVPAVAWDEVEPTLTAALGRPIAEVFATFDETPVAAASIGQVYLATLASGERVAVKVRRPGVVPLVQRDSDIALRVARRLDQTGGWAQQMGLEPLARSLTQSLADELDYGIEASNMLALRETQRELPAMARMSIPRCLTEYSTSDVLVMEYVDGHTLSEPGAVAGLDDDTRAALAGRLLAAVLAQIMDTGVFHSDLHPGNVVVTDDAQLWLLDFGSVGRLDSAVRERLADVLLAFTRGDSAAFADALLAFVELPDDLDETALRRRIGEFMARRLGPGARMDAAVFSEIVGILNRFGLSVPSELTVPFRAIATMDGTLRVLSPGFDLVAEASGYADERLAEATRPPAIAREVVDELTGLIPLVRRLPHRVDRITGDLADGRLGVNVRLLADKRDRGFVREVVSLAALAFLAGVFGIMAAMLLTSTTGPEVTSTITLFQVFGYLLLVVSGVLTLRVIFDVLRRR